ncbi:MAG TPA: adenylate/guanylate cyclase domain-containing protein [Desulfosalsimonadaceae bacterium]|nr:adenylate/guanylate cyclase domain-containing protein [Desulfosalsimonadaceae bacterium]
MRFCVECGNKLEVICPNCGFGNAPSFKFCGQCGQNLQAAPEPTDYSEPQSYTPKFLADKILNNRSAIEGERKLVTVLFADVADYTALSEKLDPEEVHQIMDGCFKILMDEIHKYEGTINQFTGDGVMALFGAPVAHEDHAQRACHAALSIQKALGAYGEKVKKDCGINFRMRIGINSGPVIVGAIGDDLRMDYTAIGDTTNLAARMESTAEPGAILVSGNTHKIACEFFEFKPLGQIELKGKAQPQDTFILVKKGDIDSRIRASVARGLTKFVGRKKSMASLLAAYEQVKSGSGQVVGIVGEAGVGKSRLVLELKNRLPIDGQIWLEGRCIQYGGNMAYLPILDLLKSYFDIKEEDREYIIQKKIAQKILQIEERLKKKLAPLQELLSVKIDDSAYLQLEPSVKKLRKFEAITEILIRESEIKPLVIVIEDLHWMDKISGELLQHLIDSLHSTRIMLILLYRPEYIHQWGSKSYYTKIGLDQLGSVSSGELVQAILEDGKPVPELKDLVLSKAGGNPLFVEEITHSLMENGFIRKRNKDYVLTRKASEIQVPDTIQGIISARIDRVEESLKRIMQVASVIGREFAFRILQSITGMKEDLKSCLLNLQGLEFIYEKRLFPELEYIFKHALTQEVAYNSLLVKRRKEIHEKIGNVIEELYAERLEEYYEVLAYHYERSQNNEKSIVYLSLANQKATNANAMEEAKGYFDKAMDILDELEDSITNRERRISLLINQFVVFEQLFKFPQYYNLLTHYESQVAEISNTGLAGGFYSRKGGCEMQLGAFDKSIESASKAVKLSEKSEHIETLVFAYLDLQWSYLFKGDFEKALALKEELLGIMTEDFHHFACVRFYIGNAVVFAMCGRWKESLNEGLHALRVSQKYSDNGHIALAAWAIAGASVLRGDIEKAAEFGEMALKIAPNPAYEAWAQCILAYTWCRAGALDKGIAVLESYVQIFRSVGSKFSEVTYATWLAEAYLIKGAFDKAEQAAREALEINQRCGVKLNIGWNHLLLGEVLLETNVSQALPHFEKSEIIFKNIKAENLLALTYAAFGRFFKLQGDATQARNYLKKALEIFERLGTLLEPEKVKKELADLPVLEAEK